MGSIQLPVAIHCKAGLGRTGTLIVLHLHKVFGMKIRPAIAWVRLCRPGSIQVSEQEIFLMESEPVPSYTTTSSETEGHDLDQHAASANQARGKVESTPPRGVNGIVPQQIVEPYNPMLLSPVPPQGGNMQGPGGNSRRGSFVGSPEQPEPRPFSGRNSVVGTDFGVNLLSANRASVQPQSAKSLMVPQQQQPQGDQLLPPTVDAREHASSIPSMGMLEEPRRQLSHQTSISVSPQRHPPAVAGGLSSSGLFNLKPVSTSNLSQYMQAETQSHPHSSQSLSQSAYDHQAGINSSRGGFSIEASPNPRNTVGGSNFNYLSAPMPQFQSNRLSVQPGGGLRQPGFEAEQYSSHFSETASPNPHHMQPQYAGVYPQQQGYLQGRSSNSFAPHQPPTWDASPSYQRQPYFNFTGAAAYPQPGPSGANGGHWNPQPTPTYPNQRFGPQGPPQQPSYLLGPPSPQPQHNGSFAGAASPQYYSPIPPEVQDPNNQGLQPQSRNGPFAGPRSNLLVTSSPAIPQLGFARQQSFNLEDQLNKGGFGHMSQSDLNYLSTPSSATRSTSVGVRPGPTGSFAPRQGITSSVLQAPQFFSNGPQNVSGAQPEVLGPRTRLGSGSANSPLKRLPIFDDPLPGNQTLLAPQTAANRSVHQEPAGVSGRPSVDSRQSLVFGGPQNQSVLAQTFQGGVRNSGSRFAGIPEAAPTRPTGGSYAPPQFRGNYF